MTIVLQVIATVLVAGLIMPVVLMEIPAARDNRVGLIVSLALMATLFVAARLVWPRPRP